VGPPDFTPKDWRRIFCACSAIQVPDHPFAYLRTFLILSFADRDRVLAAKVRRLSPAELDGLQAAIHVLQGGAG
jgi:hypothetical protein